MQTLVNSTGVSLFGYVNALKLLLRGRKRILMLGGGGGSLATMLARAGEWVTVVDIDPMAENIARRYFNLDSRVRWFTTDGLTFPTRCRTKYGAIVVDACTSTGTVAGFTRPAWIADTMSKVEPDGFLALNLAFNLLDDGKIPIDGFALAKEMSILGFHTVLLRPEDGVEGNEILVVSRQPNIVTLRKSDIMQRPAESRRYLHSLKLHRTQAVAGLAAR